MEVKSAYKETEVGVLPEDWVVTPLAGLVTIVHGFGFQSRYFKPLGKYRLTTPGHFYEAGGFRDIGDKQKFYDGPLPEGHILSAGDLIVAMTEQADGLLGSAAIVPTGAIYLHNQRIGRAKILCPELSVGFLYRVFNSNGYRAKVRATAAGTKVKHTSPARLLEIPVALPPTTTEQHAIAEALSDMDALIESLEQLIVKKRHLKQGAMQELLTGKKRLPEFHGKWRMSQLKAIVQTPITDGPHLTPRFLEDGIPFLSVNNLIENRIDLSELRFISRADHEVFSLKCKPRKDDILLGKAASVGKVALVELNIEFNIWSPIAMIRINCDNVPRFIYYQLQGADLVEQIALLTNSSSQGNIGMGDIDTLVLQLPSLPEQIAIADILTDMDSEIVVLEAKFAKARQLKQGMMNELLTGKVRLV
jgi:type I restriction enzyme S subunit